MSVGTANASGEVGSVMPKENIIRAYRPGVGLRAADAGGMPTLFGHFAVFNRFTEIDSWFEGHFMEQIARGAFKKTFREKTPKVLFQHGQDPQIGDKPLGTMESLSEDATGAAYEVQLLDTAYVRELVPGLEAGLYGASFRFKVMREEIVEEPGVSEQNPNGIPERTIKEAQVMEFGPVTFPAYDDATAGVRSLTDRFLFDALERDPERARELMRAAAVVRMDSEDLSTLAQMIHMGACYIDEQDDPGDQVNVPKMEAILAGLAALVPYEVAEDEGTEPADEGMNAGRTTTDAATSRTSGDVPAPPPGSPSGAPESLYGTRKEPQSWRL